MRTRRAGLIAASAAVTALALAGCTGNTPPPNYATTAPGGDQAPATAPPEDPPARPVTPDGNGREYEPCPDALVDGWLHAGTGDDVDAEDFELRAVGWGTQPTGDVEVVCAIELDHPDGVHRTVLTVLRGDEVPEAVAAAAEDAGMDAVTSEQTGAVASYAPSDASTSYTLFAPPDPVLTVSGIPRPDSAFLLEGTLPVDTE